MPTFAQAAHERVNGEPLEPLHFLGESGFLDTFEGPVKLKAGDKEIMVYPLTTDDYISWCQEETDTMRAARIKMIPAAASVMERHRILAVIDDSEITPDDLIAYVFRPKWTAKIIDAALAKANVNQDEAKAFRAKRAVKANEMLAVILSGLFTKAKINLMYGKAMGLDEYETYAATFGGVRPLAQGGNQGEGGSQNSGGQANQQPTGRSPDSSSKNEPVETSVK